MKQIRCCYCQSPYIPGSSTGSMMQSERFPSVFIHATCRWKIHNALGNLFCDQIPYNNLIDELINREKDS